MSNPAHSLRVDAADALQAIQGYAVEGHIRYTDHAVVRMDERAVSRQDVRCALVTATRADPQSDWKWKVSGGADLEGDGLTVVVLDAGAVVVTVF